MNGTDESGGPLWRGPCRGCGTALVALFWKQWVASPGWLDADRDRSSGRIRRSLSAREVGGEIGLGRWRSGAALQLLGRGRLGRSLALHLLAVADLSVASSGHPFMLGLRRQAVRRPALLNGPDANFWRVNVRPRWPAAKTVRLDPEEALRHE